MNDLDLEAYLDGELDAHGRSRVQAALAADAALRRRLAELEKLRALCQQAQWPLSDGGVTRRLLRRWHRLISTSKVHGMAQVAAAAALAVAVPLVSLSLWTPWPSSAESRAWSAKPFETATSQLQTAARDSRAPEVDRPLAPPTQKARGTEKTAPAGTTAYERLLMAAANRVSAQRRARADYTTRVPQWEEARTLLAQAIDKLLESPSADPVEVARTCFARPGPWEPLVAGVCWQEQGTRRRAALQLLGVVGTEQSLSLLLALGDDSQTRCEAAVVLGRIADPVQLARAIQSEAQPAVRRYLLMALASRGTPQAAQLFLNFVEQKQTADAALAALDELPDPPVQAFWPYLADARQSRRVAVARVLGRCASPVVTEELGKLALRGVEGRGALLALVSSPRQEAQVLVAELGRDPLWRGALSEAIGQL